jgi:hypothetical protein
MTEFEYEKLCRGPLSAVANEYAWGNVSSTAISGFSGADGSGTETATPASANANHSSNIGGPVRAGIFATTNSTRFAAGAGYYGAMELGGNLNEIVISAGHPEGRAFTAQQGGWAAGGPAFHLAVGGQRGGANPWRFLAERTARPAHLQPLRRIPRFYLFGFQAFTYGRPRCALGAPDEKCMNRISYGGWLGALLLGGRPLGTGRRGGPVLWWRPGWL